MALKLHKYGQGYWTRMMSAIAAGLVTLMAGKWLSNQLYNVNIEGVQPIYIQGAIFVTVVLIGAVIIYWLIGRKPRTVDFLIATEGEMKKVNWSTRREIIGSTWVVIGMTVFIGVILFVLDYIFAFIFTTIDVLETGA